MKKLYSFLSIGLLSLSAMCQSTQDVTFKVDMNNYKGTAFSGVFVNGNFNGWCGSCNALTDANKDGVWEGTVNIKADSIEYKFTLDGWTGEEALTSGTTCTKTTGVYTNRFIKLSGNVTIATVCWNSCSACSKVTSKSVTFNCNMKQYTKSFTDVYVVGTFNGWSGNANKMTDPDGDKIYSTTLTLTNDSIEYKFEVDNWKDEEKLTAGTPCVKTTASFTNRFVKLSGNKTLDNVCWASCDACTNDVTFKVDMKNYKGATFTSVYINGNFNGWCGSCNVMTDADKDGIWEVKLPLPQDSIEYKFTLDGWTGQETLTTGTPCVKTTSGFTNRFLKFSAPTVLTAVCYESCGACASTSGLNKVNIASLNLYPNPTQGLINLNMGLTQKETVSVVVFDVQGNKLYSKTLTGAAVNETIDMTAHSAGVYMVSVTTSKGTIHKEFVLNK
ncbi:MAG: hypothetical protein CK532_02500 [Flavobacteriales bacterium]|nr:T9SS type A sorting domain-containing protein [Flavobacteriaceae bacterium]PHX92479.1 MAG: hypothetical protein CK532_02500 [Flavobacteriales bacterium]